MPSHLDTVTTPRGIVACLSFPLYHRSVSQAAEVRECGENIYCRIRKNALNCTLQRNKEKLKHATMTSGVRVTVSSNV